MNGRAAQGSGGLLADRLDVRGGGHLLQNPLEHRELLRQRCLLEDGNGRVLETPSQMLARVARDCYGEGANRSTAPTPASVQRSP